MPAKMKRIALKAAYNQYNAKYFDGNLPNGTKVSWEPPSPGLMGECFPTLKPPLIRINPNLGEFHCITRLTLLHEMAHIAVHHKYGGKYRGPHGAEFQAEMLRLATMGALRWLW